MERPIVRFLDIQPYGENFILRDPYGVSQPIVINRATLLLMSLFDGKRDVNQVAQEFRRQTGIEVSLEELNSLLKELDSAHLLYNQSFKLKLEEEKRKILERGVKEAFHAGGAYPAEGEELKSFLAESFPKEEGEGERPVGILVPHMDLRVAANVYGKTYLRTKGLNPQLVLILGVSHYVHETPFSACPLDFDTPLGTCEVDREAFKKLQAEFDYDLTQDIFSYRMEHSIEFQVLYVRYLFPQAKILPVIVSRGDESLLKVIAQKLLKALESYADSLLVVSSVDMSHVGRKFGDQSNYDPSDRDREYIGLLGEMKNGEAFRLLQSDGNRTRIDGQFTNFVFLEVLKGLGARKGEEIDYRVWYEQATDSSVSFAGMGFR